MTRIYFYCYTYFWSAYILKIISSFSTLLDHYIFPSYHLVLVLLPSWPAWKHFDFFLHYQQIMQLFREIDPNTQSHQNTKRLWNISLHNKIFKLLWHFTPSQPFAAIKGWRAISLRWSIHIDKVNVSEGISISLFHLHCNRTSQATAQENSQKSSKTFDQCTTFRFFQSWLKKLLPTGYFNTCLKMDCMISCKKNLMQSTYKLHHSTGLHGCGQSMVRHSKKYVESA